MRRESAISTKEWLGHNGRTFWVPRKTNRHAVIAEHRLDYVEMIRVCLEGRVVVDDSKCRMTREGSGFKLSRHILLQFLPKAVRDQSSDLFTGIDDLYFG